MKSTAAWPLLLLLASCSHPAPSHPPQTETERKMIGLMEKFDRWDYDGNGQLDHGELEQGLAGSEHQPANVIRFYDTNKNGSISLREAQAGYVRAHEADAIIQKRRQDHE